ncbi:MAG TPA: hypothetical protein VF426_11880 [Marmoricola sp.]
MGVEQPTDAARLAARLIYRTRVGRTTPLSESEAGVAHDAFQRVANDWMPERAYVLPHELASLHSALAGPTVVDVRRATVLYELLHATLAPARQAE